MCDSAVENVPTVDAVAYSVRATIDLWDHAARNDAVGDQGIEFIGGGPTNQCGSVGNVTAQTFDVGEIDQLLGTECFRYCPGGCVGVDVVTGARVVHADGRDDGDEVVLVQHVENFRVDGGDLADESDVGLHAQFPR